MDYLSTTYRWSRLYYYLHYKRGKLRLRIRDLLKSIHSNVFTEYLQCDKEGAGERLNIKMDNGQSTCENRTLTHQPGNQPISQSCRKSEHYLQQVIQEAKLTPVTVGPKQWGLD